MILPKNNSCAIFIYFVVLIFSGVNFYSCSVPENIEQKIILSQKYITNDKLDSAQVILETAITLDPSNVILLNQLAEIHFRKLEIGKALIFYNKSVLLDSTNADVHFKIAEIKLFLGDYKEVFNSINKGLRIDERKPRAYFMKGVAYKHIGDTVKAISCLKTAIEIQNNFSPVYYELGLLLTYQKDSLAIDYYKNGIDLNPDDPGLLSSLAWCYEQFNKTTEANKTYYKLLTKFPNYKLGKTNYALFKLGLKELDTALVLCNEVLEMDSLDYRGLNLKGIIFNERGDLKESIKIKQKLLNFDSKSDF